MPNHAPGVGHWLCGTTAHAPVQGVQQAPLVGHGFGTQLAPAIQMNPGPAHCVCGPTKQLPVATLQHAPKDGLHEMFAHVTPG